MNRHRKFGRHGESSAETAFGDFGRRHGGGRMRLINRGELRHMILKLLEAGPRHGYELLKDFEDRSGGTYAPSPGMIYPCLAMLEQMGEITGIEDSGRRQFALTEAGKAAIAGKDGEINAVFTRIEEAGKRRSTIQEGPIRRAIDNLRQVLGERGNGEPLTREMQLAIADMIDEAARKIERL